MYNKKFKMIQAICNATLIENNKIMFFDNNNETTINDFKIIINKLNSNKEINYTLDDNKIYFSNGSIIEILQNDKNDMVKELMAKRFYILNKITYFD